MGFMRASAPASIRPRVESVSGTCSDSTSAASSTSSSVSLRSTGMSAARSSVRYGSYATTPMPKARQRRATSPPMRPAPTRPSVRPRSSTPLRRERAHSPARTEASASATLRAIDSTSASVSSAADTVLPAGAFSTATPRSVAASRSMLSTPTPARPTTRSRGARASISPVTLVALRTISPSASASASPKAGSAGSSTCAISKRASPRSGASPAADTLSVTSTRWSATLMRRPP